MTESITRLTDRLANQNDVLQGRLFEAYEKLGEMIVKQNADVHAQNMRELEFGRSTEERRKWIAFMPALVNQLLGKELFPQSTEDTALIEAIADAITPEQIQQLSSVGILKPEILGPLYNRVLQHTQKKIKLDEDVKRLTASAPSEEEEEAAE